VEKDGLTVGKEKNMSKLLDDLGRSTKNGGEGKSSEGSQVTSKSLQEITTDMLD